MRGSSQGQIVGTVRNFRIRSEPPPVSPRLGSPTLIWAFQVEPQSGMSSQSPVVVEMRGNTFEGVIDNGDEVVIRASARPGEVVSTQEVYNQSKNIRVKGSYYQGSPKRQLLVPRASQTVANIFAVIFVIGFVLVVLWIVINQVLPYLTGGGYYYP